MRLIKRHVHNCNLFLLYTSTLYATIAFNAANAIYAEILYILDCNKKRNTFGIKTSNILLTLSFCGASIYSYITKLSIAPMHCTRKLSTYENARTKYVWERHKQVSYDQFPSCALVSYKVIAINNANAAHADILHVLDWNNN